MKQIHAVLLGAGDRGNAYAKYALEHPYRLKFAAVAEPNREKRGRFGTTHCIPEEKRYEDWRDLLQQPKLADIILICTQDKMHYAPAVKALEKGYHVLLEKPMSVDPIECIKLAQCAEKADSKLNVCYVLRYTDFFATIKDLLVNDRIGRLISIQHNENVPMIDQVHSFVRGNWRNSEKSCPMILAHCCHDLDIISWFAEGKCTKVSSFGSLSWFKSENAPEGSPERCLDGCPHYAECAYYAPDIYLGENTEWPVSVISNSMALSDRMKALIEGPYGRCVYRCDNNVVDHQVAIFEFDNNITATFTMCAFTSDSSRTLKLMGTKGEIRAAMERNEIEVTGFKTGTKEFIYPKKSKYRYGGGDHGIMEYLVRRAEKNDHTDGLTSAGNSLASHLMAFTAEKSRLENKIIWMEDFIREIIQKDKD